jgi:hypothetical protein
VSEGSVDRLRSELLAAGYPIPTGDDLGRWTDAIAHHRRTTAAAPTPLQAQTPMQMPSFGDLAELFAGDGDLTSLFDEEDAAPAVVVAAAPPATPNTPQAQPANPPGGSWHGAGAPVETKPVEAAAQVAAGDGSGPAMRPEPAPQAAKRSRRTRAVRTRAAPPDRPLPLAAVGAAGGDDGGTVIPDTLSQALLAAVCIPRPVFAADLVAVAGSMEAVAAWEQHCRVENLPVRIIPAKLRHAQRGSLVFPVDDARTMTTEFRRSLWADVLNAKDQAYRGARLYELGVLLHRVGEQVVSHQLGAHTTTLRLAQPGGLTGVVVCFGAELGEGSDLRSELVGQVEGLIGERLATVVVLTTSGEAAALPALIETVAAEAAARRWQPSMPVVAARSWEYANTRGSCATMILG